MELYKVISLIVASIVVFFIVLFMMRDLFVDMRNRNIAQMSKKRDANKVTKNEVLGKSRFKVYKGSNKKKVDNYRNKPILVKIK